MVQPEIAYINKLIRIRLAAARLKANRKPNVEVIAVHLKTLIDANLYSKPNESRSFLFRHSEEVEYLIPSGKPKLREEFNNFARVKPNEHNIQRIMNRTTGGICYTK